MPIWYEQEKVFWSEMLQVLTAKQNYIVNANVEDFLTNMQLNESM